MADLVDVTLRIYPRNLESLLSEHHPTSEIWLSELEPGVYALEASVPIGFEASRDLPNLMPGNKLDQLSAATKRDLADEWEAQDA